ncbi:hypothetical protein [Streptomyces sp. DSM 118148]
MPPAPARGSPGVEVARQVREAVRDALDDHPTVAFLITGVT